MAKMSALKGAACGGAMALCKSTCAENIATAQAELATAQQQMQNCVNLNATNQAAIPTCQEPWLAKKVKAEKEIAADKRVMARCASYNTNMIMSLMQGMSFGQNMAQNKACVNAASGNSFSGVGSLGSSVDCTNAEIAKVSPTCICQADPTNAICPGAASTGTTGGMAGPTSGKTDASSSLYANDGSVDPGSSLSDKAAAVKSAKGSNTIDGGGGGGPSGGFGGGGGGSDGGGAAGKGSDKSAISGLAGGSGSGVGGAGGGSSGSRSVRGTLNSLLEKLNLKKLLPSSKDYKTRGLAGMSIKSSDGITGPMGPSLFEKVSTQYQRQKTNLILDK
jgi:uncharacterized membrane protein YgcG